MPRVRALFQAPEDYLRYPERYVRYLLPHRHLGSAFGDDWFGQFAEKMARIFGTPAYIVAQTLLVILWVICNGYAIFVHFDPFPYILLNLLFSTQAAYAAPLILLAQTRQAERDKVRAEADARHREDLAQASSERMERGDEHVQQLRKLIEQNTALTEQTKELAERLDELTRDIHGRVCA
jgi:uncharacterized membrane protein